MTLAEQISNSSQGNARIWNGKAKTKTKKEKKKEKVKGKDVAKEDKEKEGEKDGKKANRGARKKDEKPKKRSICLFLFRFWGGGFATTDPFNPWPSSELFRHAPSDNVQRV